ncbi:bifunctional diaminohydroxyphosphoribosylaminopyrimidine deaminase/5-amino-6-(5-phosphoribosylamino)uracil reductase RibD [Candidatus Nitrotoga fabula]|nr:bifunctional diaminohydroxyphosphoribosylaminopyrimidine deaminase/5-amino-6-(5-phosphoribosylamino)uracil reductase RibD [Candidatus Nitrotoga fabula]
MLSEQDSRWMAVALQLAERGLYTTCPNPRVGCVLVRDGQIVGEGWHRYAGEPHAEIHALHAAGQSARGATAYVTLEPCSHHGRTPPCADALVSAGVKRVVAAVKDPNPQVAGQGMNKLRAAGIEIDCGLMENVARELNIGFFSRMSRGLPWLRSKIAMSLDGRTALRNGASQWISCTGSRQDVQRWRGRSCAVLTGIGTVLADDPRLTLREPQLTAQESENGNRKTRSVSGSLRVVLDSRLQLPVTARILHGGNVRVYTVTHDSQKIAALEKVGAQVVVLPDVSGRVDLNAALRDLAANGCNEVLVEAGAVLNGALLQAGLVDELLIYVAPQLLGDMARGIAELGELTRLDQRIELEWQDVRNVGMDLRILARVKRK